ncbi:30S ribosomal protein S2 [bacterium BMS3Abin15]|nr:30S ribosomal protein S2 [bacterium BMS3Abin15]
MKKEETKPAKAQDALQTKDKPSSEDYFADFDFKNLETSMEEMLKNGVHFGHQKSRRNPKMDEYIFTTRDGMNIINLQETSEKLEEALEFAKKIKKEGKKILFVGTKKQAKDLTRSAAKRCEMPYSVERWLGGTFTNFKVIRGRTKYLKDSQEDLAKGKFEKYTKFERMKKAEELEKLEKKMGGIKDMDDLPGAVFIVDINENSSAVREAAKVGVPIISLTDTNVDPLKVDYPIPANDDAISSIRLMLGYVCKAIIES